MIKTKGNVIIENIKIGDIHYEYGYGMCIKSKVLTLPTRNKNGLWVWTSLNLTTNKEIRYAVSEDYIHYSSNLYDYEAYKIEKYI